MKATYWISNSGKKYPANEYGNNGGGRIVNSSDGKALKDLPDDYPYTLEFEELTEDLDNKEFGSYPDRGIKWVDDKKDGNGNTVINGGWYFCPIPPEPKDEIEAFVEEASKIAKTNNKRLAKACANWLTGPVAGYMNENGFKDGHSPSIFFDPDKLRELAIYVEFTDFLDFGTAKRKVFPRLIDNFGDETVYDIMDELGLWDKSDDNEVEKLIEDVLSKFPEEVERFKGGEEKLFGMLMGQVMRSKGKMSFNAKDANVLLRKKLTE